MAPVNPADINLVQGVYPIPLKFPTVGGIEGVGEIIESGPNVTRLQPGDKVIPDKEGFGTWRSHGVFNADELYQV